MKPQSQLNELGGQPKPKLLVLVGPTAVGKTRLSLDIARSFDCEIISGDSMQVYRGMDIGTAKATPEERSVVPHHMIDIVDPTYSFSVAEFQERTREWINDINRRGRLPFLVGGTGLYVESVAYAFEFSEVGNDEAYRQEMRAFAEQYGVEALYAQLQEVDPDTAARLHPNDTRRVIRALEVYHLTGTTMSEQLQGQEKKSPYDLCIVGLTMDRTLLYKRIEERIDLMLGEGLVDEVKALMDQGCTREHVSMHGLGYKEILGFLEGEYDFETAVGLLKRDTRRFAKRQLSWFRHMKDIHWIDVTDQSNYNAHLQQISGIIAKKFPLSENP